MTNVNHLGDKSIAQPLKKKNKRWNDTIFKSDGFVWFLFLMAYQLFLGYLMPKPFS